MNTHVTSGNHYLVPFAKAGLCKHPQSGPILRENMRTCPVISAFLSAWAACSCQFAASNFQILTGLEQISSMTYFKYYSRVQDFCFLFLRNVSVDFLNGGFLHLSTLTAKHRFFDNVHQRELSGLQYSIIIAVLRKEMEIISQRTKWAYLIIFCMLWWPSKGYFYHCSIKRKLDSWPDNVWHGMVSMEPLLAPERSIVQS